MNLFKINYMKKIAELFEEAFKFKKYKVMNPVLAVFSGILVIPFVLFGLAMGVYLYVISFAFEIANSLVKSLHSVLKDEGRETMHITQVIIYLISWPTVFTLYVMECILLFFITFSYDVLSINVYMWTFGGIKFHLMVTEEDISVEVTEKYTIIPLVYVIVGYMFFIGMPIIHGIIHYINLYYAYNEKNFLYSFLTYIYPQYFNLGTVFNLLYSLYVMPNFPRKKR